MPSTFGSLSLASSALAAHRRSVDVAGQNIANVNTPGYSRQRVDLAAIGQTTIGLHTGQSIAGGGVDVAGQTRIVDTFITQRLNREHAAMGHADELRTAYARIEQAFAEPGEDGIGARMAEFWDAWDAVVSAPEDLAARTALLQRAEAVGDAFRGTARALQDVAGDALQRAQAVAVDITGAAARIAELNADIAMFSATGAPPNELLDERDQLVSRIAEHADVRTHTDDRGMLSVVVGGATLVSGARASALELDASVPGAAVVRLVPGGSPVGVTGGGLAGLLEVANSTVPQQLAALDAVALQLVDLVNTQHRLGLDLQDPPQAGQDLLAATGAVDLGLAAGMAGRPDLVAAAAAGGGRLDAGNAAILAGLAGVAGGPDERYRALVADLGVRAAGANQRADLQERVTAQVEAERASVSGVSIDEEMANLVAFQQAYQAAARFLTAVDEMIGHLISSTGHVGR